MPCDCGRGLREMDLDHQERSPGSKLHAQPSFQCDLGEEAVTRTKAAAQGQEDQVFPAKTDHGVGFADACVVQLQGCRGRTPDEIPRPEDPFVARPLESNPHFRLCRHRNLLGT